jgi:hypothetical protein
MRLFSGIKVTENLVGMREYGIEKCHNRGSLNEVFSPSINNAYERPKSIGAEKRRTYDSEENSPRCSTWIVSNARLLLVLQCVY